MTLWPGQPHPLGANWNGLGVNFALFSAHAESVELLLFDHAEDRQPARTLVLPERTGPIWHGFVPGLRPGQLYGFRVHGPYQPEAGHRFNAHKVLLDPYAKALGRPLAWHDSLFGYQLGDPTEDLSFDTRDSAPYAPLGAVVEDAFSWGNDRPPAVPWEDTVVYETHVKGISRLHPGVDPALRGTYLGLASPAIVEHLLSLGITTVELLPVQAFVNDRRLVDMGLSNYWGYNPLAFFAPEPSYATSGPGRAVNEFKMMVRALHEAGLEVVIDVVYNHSGEGNQLGPTLAYRGIDNRSYYKLADEPRYYQDYTGTGNTFDAGQPHVLQLITDSLRYWVTEMHVDGFRFDLATTLARESTEVDMRAAFFQAVQQDPVLSRVKLIAEPWDVGEGGYQVGNFPWYWAEWNGRYRDAVRAYWRGNPGMTGELATRVTGSSDLYQHDGRRPYASVNFVTAHDGFTLEDLVSYQHKHNQANGEANHDGSDHDMSQNFGVEGPTDDPKILERRDTAKRSLLATLLLSQGTPMLLGGDELSRSQHGNNNAYCQDNELSWYHWQLNDRQEAFLAFVRDLLAFHKAHPILRRRHFLTGDGSEGACKDVSWWHPGGREMTENDWREHERRALGMLLCGERYLDHGAEGAVRTDDSLLVLFHGYRAERFTLPPEPGGGAWERALSTGRQPRRVLEPGRKPMLKPGLVSVFRAVPYTAKDHAEKDSAGEDAVVDGSMPQGHERHPGLPLADGPNDEAPNVVPETSEGAPSPTD